MKQAKLFAASLAAMALVGCTSEDYVGVVDNPTGDGIGFGSGVTSTTRANATGSQAAEKLNNNFIVYGFKTTTAEDADQVVFDAYNVNYMPGTANTTESNTADWEYVGYAPHSTSSASEQSIKYWDFSQQKYVFSAVSGTGITATKIKTGSSVYDKGWDIELPAGGSLADLYASDRKEVLPGDYKKQVNLTFRALTSKIRFAMFETVPGYEIHIDKFYYNESSTATKSWKNTETNFAIDGTFKTANKTKVTPLTITYYDDASGIENQPKVTFDDDKVNTSVYGEFGANIQATSAIGTTSAEATYDQSDKSYTMILPYEGASNALELYVDYTLTSTDGSGETIKVYHASAKVPSNFAQWKPNFAYTYIFKISDSSNGTTVTPGTPGGTDPSDPDDFDPNDPEDKPGDDKIGLFPITFDAVVITDETDVQETITSVSDPSITTYQKGAVVTANDEYVAGDIYFENGAANVSGYKVYEVKNFGTEATTEEVVANYLNNFCVLTEVETTDASTTTPAGIPLNDGTYISKTANQAKFFAAEAGKTYVICDEATPTKHYKVVKVAGTPAAVSYTVGSDATITSVDGTATITVKQGTVGVLGVTPNFTVVGTTNGNSALKISATATAGEYTVSVDAAAIAAGKANDTYKVSFDGNDVTITVNISTALAATSVNIVAGNTTGANATLKIAGAAADGDVTEVPDGITIEKTATGTYKVTAAADMADGSYSAKIAGQTLTINVDSYEFADNLVITKALSGTSTGTLTLKKNNDPTGVTVALNGVNTSIATVGTPADGEYEFTAVAGGSFDVTYENAKAKVTVNEYTIATPAAIAKSTGSAVIEVKCNGEAINATTASLVEKTTGGKPDGAVYNVSTNGKTIKFSGASLAGDYKFDYKVNGVVVADVTITVNP